MNPSIRDWLQGVGPGTIGIASVGAIAVAAIIVFRIARRVVQIGYFAFYFLIGFVVVYGAIVASTSSLTVPMTTPIVGGLAFAAAAALIRAKLMRIVSGVMLVALFGLAGKFWVRYAQKDRDRQTETHRQEANRALSAVRRDFRDVARQLPAKNGKIEPGWVPPATLEKLGVDPDLQRTVWEKAWHTFLTGMYEEEQQELGVWTSGGTPEQARKGLILKPKGVQTKKTTS